MNEDFFTGFEHSFLFYDEENDSMLVFQQNSIVEVSIGDDVYLGKWRFSKQKKILEVFIDDLTVKYLYKLDIVSNNEDNILLKAKYLIKYENNEEENKKGETSLIRTKNTINSMEEPATVKLERFVVLGFFFLIFSVLLLISSFIPAFSSVGVLYVSVFILTIEILFINKIKSFVKKRIHKYEEKINSMFYD